jgi:hypothetical protein
MLHILHRLASPAMGGSRAITPEFGSALTGRRSALRNVSPPNWGRRAFGREPRRSLPQGAIDWPPPQGKRAIPFPADNEQ